MLLKVLKLLDISHSSYKPNARQTGALKTRPSTRSVRQFWLLLNEAALRQKKPKKDTLFLSRPIMGVSKIGIENEIIRPSSL
jgi:hypothetical protein